MKNKKGFTLIELLAVIVILAIIALVAVPIILNMISTAKKKAAMSAAYGYIDAINYNNQLASMKTDYTDMTYEKIDDGTNISVTTVNSQLKMKGKKPTIGKVDITNGKVSKLTNVVFDGYKVKSDNGKSVQVVGKASNIPDPESFSTDSWETIANAIENNKASVYHLGDTKNIKIDNETYQVRIVNTNTPSDCSHTGFSKTACGFVFEFVNPIGESTMGDDDLGWPNSNGWKYLNDETDNNSIYNKLPSDLKAVIKKTYSVSGKGNRSGATDNFTSEDYLYLLDPKEVWNSNDGASSNTKQLEWYVGKTNDDIIKRTSDNNARQCWLRSAVGTKNFYAIYAGGSGNNADRGYSKWILPAFKVG